MSSLHSFSLGAGTGHDVDSHTITIRYSSLAKSEVRIKRSGSPSYSGDFRLDDCTLKSRISNRLLLGLQKGMTGAGGRCCGLRRRQLTRKTGVKA